MKNIFVYACSLSHNHNLILDESLAANTVSINNNSKSIIARCTKDGMTLSYSRYNLKNSA